MRFVRHRKLLLSFLTAAACLAQSPVRVPETVEIPAGTFQMGSADGAAWEQPVHDVEISAFAIGKRPVTNAEFRAFRHGHRSATNANDEAPVTDVSWEDATAYCRWLSARTGETYRLPTEAEWERAARGGLAQKKYPWGDEAPDVLAAPTADGHRAEVRPNAFGVIAGSYNLWEWTADRYSPSYYETSPPKDPLGPDEGDYRVVRGGGFRHDPVSMRCSNRGSARPATASEVITFRVVKGAAPAPAPPVVSEVKPADPEPDQPAPAVQMSRLEIPSPAKRAEDVPAPGPDRGVARLRDIQVEAGDDGLSVLLATGAAVTHTTMVLSNPLRLVVDLPRTIVSSGGMSARDVGEAGVSRIRWAQFQREPPVARVVFDLTGKPDFSIESTPQGPVVQVKAVP